MNIVFLFSDRYEKRADFFDEFSKEQSYLKNEGIDSVYYIDADAEALFNKIQEENNAFPKGILFVCESLEDFSFISENGGYAIGMSNTYDGTVQKFPKAKYIFSGVDDTFADSFIKAYQRLSGEPWDILETPRLIVRETTVSDVDAFYEIYKDKEMTRYMEDLFKNPEDEKRYMQDYIDKVYGLMGFGVWTVIRKEDNAIIGRAGFSVRNGFDEVELGFLIGVSYQRNGYAYEVCSSIIEYGRKMLGFDKIQCLVKKENKASISLCTKLGFCVSKEVEIEEDIYNGVYLGSETENKAPSKKGIYVKFVI